VIQPTFKTNNFLPIVIALLSSFAGMSQNNTAMETLNTSGNDALGSAGSVSYSIGQVFFTYIGESVYNVAQGIQQTHLADDTENIDPPEDIDSPEVAIVVYPNPTTDYVNLSMKGVDLENGQNTYQLFSYQGKLLRQQIIEEDLTEINLSNLSSSIYLLQVFVKNKIWKSFKILKK
jgi:Secretion system C-terminal sorting domain